MVACIAERKVTTVSHRICNDDITQEKFKGTRVLFVKRNTVQPEPQCSLTMYKVLQSRIRRCSSEIIKRHERHGREHAFFQVPHAMPGRFAGVHYDCIHKLADGNIDSDVEALLRWLTQVKYPAIHTWHSARKL